MLTETVMHEIQASLSKIQKRMSVLLPEGYRVATMEAEAVGTRVCIATSIR